MDGATVFQVAAQANAQAGEGALFMAQGNQIGQRLGGMQMSPIPRVDNGNPGVEGGRRAEPALG